MSLFLRVIYEMSLILRVIYEPWASARAIIIKT